MKEFSYIVKLENGVHARPAGILVKEATKFKSSVKIQTENRFADAKKLFSVMGLCIKRGNIIKLIIDGVDEEEALLSLKGIIESNF